MVHSTCMSRSGRRWRTGIVACVMAVTVLCGQPTLTYGMGNRADGSFSRAAAAVGTSGKPNRANPTSGTKSVLHLPPAPKLPASKPLSSRPAMPNAPASGPVAKVLLDPNTATSVTTSDGRMEIDVPAGAVSTADVAAAGGQLSLQLSQIAPPSGALSGGSGLVSFGTYGVQVLDSAGTPTGHGLRLAATLKLHYGKSDGAFDLEHAFVIFNGAHPANIAVLGSYATQPVTYDSQNQVLVASLPADTSLASTGGATPTPTATASPIATASPSATAAPAASPSATAAPAASPSATAHPAATATGATGPSRTATGAPARWDCAQLIISR